MQAVSKTRRQTSGKTTHLGASRGSGADALIRRGIVHAENHGDDLGVHPPDAWEDVWMQWVGKDESLDGYARNVSMPFLREREGASSTPCSMTSPIWPSV